MCYCTRHICLRLFYASQTCRLTRTRSRSCPHTHTQTHMQTSTIQRVKYRDGCNIEFTFSVCIYMYCVCTYTYIICVWPMSQYMEIYVHDSHTWPWITIYALELRAPGPPKWARSLFSESPWCMILAPRHGWSLPWTQSS